MKKLIYLIIPLMIMGCDRPTKRTVYSCDCEQQKKSSEFVQNSIKNANNMSDEEMEDVINQLERTAIRLNCGMKMVDGIQHDGWFEITQQDKGYTYYDY